MPHACTLRVEVSPVIFIGSYLDRHILDHTESETFKTCTFDRIVGNQPHVTDSELGEYLRPYTVVAFIGFMSEMQIGIDRIHTLFLELVSADFFHQTYASSFLIEVQYHAPSLLFYHLHGAVELLAAVTSL